MEIDILIHMWYHMWHYKGVHFLWSLVSLEGGEFALLHGKWVLVFIFSFVLHQLITCSHSGRDDSFTVALTLISLGYQEWDATGSILWNKKLKMKTKLTKLKRTKPLWPSVRSETDWKAHLEQESLDKTFNQVWLVLFGFPSFWVWLVFKGIFQAKLTNKPCWSGSPNAASRLE